MISSQKCPTSITPTLALLISPVGAAVDHCPQHHGTLFSRLRGEDELIIRVELLPLPTLAKDQRSDWCVDGVKNGSEIVVGLFNYRFQIIKNSV